jgi:hypothetical protein
LEQLPPQPASSTYACRLVSPSRAGPVESIANVATLLPAPAPRTSAFSCAVDRPRTGWPVLDAAEVLVVDVLPNPP